MLGTTLKITKLTFAAWLLSIASVASAHEDHNALGAGPGPETTAPPTTGNSSVTPSARTTPTDDHMGMGSMTPSTGSPHGGSGGMMPMDGMQEGANPNASFAERLVSWLGRMHPMVIHFPIALFIGAFGIELFGLWRGRRDYQHVAHVMLVVGALGAVVAAFLGWFAGGFYLTDRNPILMTHRWLGTVIAIMGIVLATMAARQRRTPERSRTIYWALLGLMTLVISLQGFLGATFMHGGLKHLAF